MALQIIYLYSILLVTEILATATTPPNVLAKDAPKFPLQYSVQGNIVIPYSEINEPFFAWYDSSVGSSRIDYYGGMVKTYQLSREGKYGQLLKVAPVTTEYTSNVQTCLQVNGTSDYRVPLQTVFPDLTEYEYIGEELIREVTAEKWQLVQKIEERFNKYTMYLTYKKIEGTAEKVPVPVKFTMKGYNVIFGSHFDHYYIDYFYYSDSAPDPTVFQLKDLVCEPFPGPGIEHIYTFNPMREYIIPNTELIDNAFDNFIKKHNKHYVKHEDHSFRKEIFKRNYRLIQSRNRANLGYTLVVNHLADRTDLELKGLNGRKYTEGYNGGKPFVMPDDYKLPSNFDWRLYGAVTPVKDQSVCGSCWSFGTTGTIEGAYFLKYGKQAILSQQALIDCSWGFGNNGCDGGEDFRSYQWILKHGLPTEEDYGPYYGQDGYCHINSVNTTANITGWVNVTANDPNALRTALVQNGPISIAIDASHKTLSFYSSGVYYEPKCSSKESELDHAVLLVGYGNIAKQDYWLVKNSWSTYWGNDGYVLMSTKNNNCGVMTSPTYVEIK